MELVKLFNSELSSLYESKPPISKAKMTSITRTAIKAIKLYKHVVQSVEKFIQKCKPEYKVPGLYVIDSIVRQSRHQFGTEKDVFAPRFARNLQQTFVFLFNCPAEDKSKVIRVLNLWQKNAVFDSEVIQPLFDLADPNHPIYKEQGAVPPTNGITPVKPVPPASVTPKNASVKKEGSTAGWVNQINTEPNMSSNVHSNQSKSHAQAQGVDANILQQLQQLQTLLMDQQAEKAAQAKDDQIKFDKKLLDFDYGEEEDEDGPPAHHHNPPAPTSNLDSIGSILSNPEILRQLQTIQQSLTNPQHLRQQQLDMEEKMRKMQEMKQQEEEFDKHLAQTVPNLPFADECDLKPGVEAAAFAGTDFSQPPPGYPHQQKMVMPGMMLKPPPSPLEDGEHASSDADDRMMGRGEEGGPSVVVLDSDSPNDSPAHRRRRRRSRSHSHSHRRSRSDSRSRSRNKRKRSSSYEEKDWEKAKMREAEKERERERKRKGLPSIKKNHLAVCSTTLWIGHLSKLVQQEELSDTFGEFGDIVSIDLIPPRGCAFICMNRRQDAYRALQDLKHCKLQGKTITLAWAPGKGMKGKEYKDYWEVDQGVSYIPWIKLTPDIDLELIEEGGMIDEDSFPEWLKDKQKKHKDDDHQRSQSSSQAEDDDTSKGTELDIPVPAPTLPGFIPLPDGPQPPDIKVNQPPPNMASMMSAGPPLGMMPPPFLPNVPRLLGPMGMAMGPGLMPNVPLGVPPPGMQGLMGNHLMHQQMMGRMPQPVGSPFNPPPGVSILSGHPQLSQIPLPRSQDKGKSGLPPLGVPPPTDASGLPPFGDPMMQIPFTLPPQLQMPGLGMLSRNSLSEKMAESSAEDDKKINSSPSRNPLLGIQAPFGQPPPQFSPMSLMKIPPPMSGPPPDGKMENTSTSIDKDEREIKDKDYREKDYKDRDKERDRDYRNKRDRDYRGDRDYRDRFDKDYRERDKDYRERRERRDRSKEKDKDDKFEENKTDEKDKKEDGLKEDKNYRDRNDRDRSRNRDRDRERDRGRERGSKWADRERDRGRDRERDDRRGRDRERDRSKEMKGDREKAAQDRQRNMGHDKERGNEFPRNAADSENFQGRGGPRSRGEPFHPDGFSPDMHGRHHGNRLEAFDRGPRDLFDHRGPPPDGFDPRGPPPDGFNSRGPPPDGFGQRGPPPDGFGPRGPHLDGFGPRGPPPEGFGLRGPPPEGFGPRGPPDGFDRRGPPPDGFDPRGPPPDGFDPRGPPPGNFGPPDGFDHRGPPPDFDGIGPAGENFNMRGPPPDSFNRNLISDNFGPGGPPSDFVHRGSAADEFGGHGHPYEGFSGPPGEFQPRIRIEFFSRGRGRGLPQDSFRGRGGRGAMFPGRGSGPRGPRPGTWMEAQGPSPPKSGFGFLPPRKFAPESGPEHFGAPVFEDSGRGRGGSNLRGRGRGFQGRQDEHRRDEDDREMPSPKRISRWSNPSPPPGYIAPGVEQKLEFDLESRLKDTEISNSSENMDLVQQESNDGNAEKTIEEGASFNLNDSAPDDKSEHDLNKPTFNEDIDKQFMEVNPDPDTRSFLNDDSPKRLPLDSALRQEESNVFTDIGNDSSSMQLSNIDSIKEQDASLLFTQDSQSMADVEMSDSHLNFESSSKERPDHFFDSPKDNETVPRSFADVGLSFSEDNDDVPSLGHQRALTRSEENLSKYMNPPAEVVDDILNKPSTSNPNTNDGIQSVQEESFANLEHRNFDFASNINHPLTGERSPVLTSQVNVESDLPEETAKEFIENNNSYDKGNSSHIHISNEKEEESKQYEVRESVNVFTMEQILPVVNEHEVLHSDMAANEPSQFTLGPGQDENAVVDNTVSGESSAVIDPSVLHEQSNS